MAKIEELSPEYDVILQNLTSTLHQISLEQALNNSSDEAIKNLASKKQIGGSHYKALKISPTEYVYANNLSWNLGNVVKYITRRKTDQVEDRVNDLLKAKHCIDLELQMVYGKDADGNDIGPYTIETKV